MHARPRDEAVSPVIAVILMVAITVVLAATVYVWLTGFQSSQDKVADSSFVALPIDLPATWNDPDATSEVDGDRKADAIEVTLASGIVDLEAVEVVVSFDGELLVWDPLLRMFFAGGDSNPGEVCATSPGGDADDLWERGGSFVVVKAAPGVDAQDLCDGQASEPTDFSSLAGSHSLRVTVRDHGILERELVLDDDPAA